MKRAAAWLPFGLVFAVALDGCAAFHDRMAAPTPAPAVVPAASAPGVETVPFHTGVSSATVEKMARQQGCSGGPGAGLVTEPGPVEVYRMRCEDGAMRGQVFMARCELRQCRWM